jgi:hypothetical protein
MTKKTFPVMLEVEEIALGAVLRKLHDMPGVVKLDLIFGEGGKGAGRDKLQQEAAALNVSPEEAILKALAAGPMKSRDLIRATGMRDHRIYYAIGKLGASIIRNSNGEFQLATLALPAPTVAKFGRGGRATPGSAAAVMRVALRTAGGPVKPKDLRSILTGHGISPKSVHGVLERAKRDGVIKDTKDGIMLTAKAERNGVAHG